MTLDEEKKKALYSHRLEIRRIWLEKILLGFLIGLAGLIGNVVFERYKSGLVKTQFLLENRLKGLKEIRDSYSALVQHAYLKTMNDGAADPAAYGKAVHSFLNTTNQWGFLFSGDFDRELTHYGWLHQAMADPKVTLSRKEHWGFINDFSQAFDAATRTALNVEVLDMPDQVPSRQFSLRIWKSEEVLTKGTVGLFRDNLDKWRKEHQSQGSP